MYDLHTEYLLIVEESDSPPTSIYDPCLKTEHPQKKINNQARCPKAQHATGTSFKILI